LPVARRLLDPAKVAGQLDLFSFLGYSRWLGLVIFCRIPPRRPKRTVLSIHGRMARNAAKGLGGTKAKQGAGYVLKMYVRDEILPG
jgi:hypothetical protein